MAEITAAIVKALREETGQGMMECKKALQESNGDVEAARDILRKKGLATAEKKAARVTKEGRVAIAATADKSGAAMVEIQCETDFCARNEVFQEMVQVVARLAADAPAGTIEPTPAIKDAVQDALSKIGENMSFARGVKVVAPRIGAYIHHNGKVGVLVGVEGEISDEVLSDLCMHIAFADPMGITMQDVPADLVEKERAFAREQAAESGKPADIVEKMVTGKINKFLAERALLEQPFVRDDKKKVKDIVGKAKVLTFARYSVGA
ncbi:MAG: Elongation factor Ts [Planctomycetes bacterium ADurb.Bin126]|nr:MAG: Elongation factor Ts [Planctomycetes bacterium ADurb.Bin126]HQL75776.1 translation elongation factor Ts [Phycisphaerae bacterium]